MHSEEGFLIVSLVTKISNVDTDTLTPMNSPKDVGVHTTILRLGSLWSTPIRCVIDLVNHNLLRKVRAFVEPVHLVPVYIHL